MGAVFQKSQCVILFLKEQKCNKNQIGSMLLEAMATWANIYTAAEWILELKYVTSLR